MPVTPPPRRPGRPAKTGQENLRERLLDIALTLLARHGAADTTVTAIAKAAGITPAAAHYYFKTREQLLDALLDERFLPVKKYFEGVFENNLDDPVATITELVLRLVQLNEEHPWFGAFWIREMISDDDVFKQRANLRSGNPKQALMLDAIRRWQAEGKVNAALDPVLLFNSVLGVVLLPLTASRKWHNDALRGHLKQADIVRHAIALLTQGLQP